ncbi:MAG: discoidin domain-containing protein [Opitutaceae bacterium]|nr:discoidin domain-containing protein [Opitutaceae bacterium]
MSWFYSRRYFFFVLLVFVFGSSASATDLDTLRQRIHTDLVAKTDKSEAAAYVASQNTDGSWTDVNYADKDESRWLPVIHLRRLVAIGAAYYTSGHALHQSPTALTAIERGLTYWYGRNSTSNNWWHIEVNTPQQLGAVLVMCYDDLLPATITNGAAELFAGKSSWSGQNRIYTSFSGVYQAILQNNPTYLATQFTRIRDQARYKGSLSRTGVSNNNEAEGIRIDHSFYQHGPALYNGFYGAHYVTDMAFWMAMSDGLSFAFTPAEKAVVQDYVLEGQGWMNRFGVLDPNTVNRKISHDNYDYVTLRYHAPIVYGLEYLRSPSLALPRATEIEAFYQHMVNGAPSQISGNRAFWKTDFMVQAGAGYQVSTKLWSWHNYGTETINGDNLQGIFLPLGGTFLLQNGNEYLEIFPVWDWGRIPGTTTLRRDPGSASPANTLGTQKFAGGVSNGTEGATAYDHSYDTVTAKKSWFYFAEAYVMLGAGINGNNVTLPVNSTVNQARLGGAVTISATAGESTFPVGESAPAGLSWVFHDNVGYLLPAGGNVTVARKAQSGSWREINDDLPSTTLTKDVFSLWFNHGTAPVNDTYAAVVVPASTRTQFDAFRTDNPIGILANTSAIQAVRHSSRQLVQAAFFQAGTLTTPQGLIVTVTQPCLVMVDQATSPATVTVADPTQELVSVQMTITEPGQAPRALNYTLPTGDNAGRSTSTTSVAPPPLDPILSGTVIAFSQQTSATANGQAAYVTDGIVNDDNQRWAANTPYPQWVEIDLGADYLLTSSEVFTYLNRDYRFRIEAQPNGGTYSVVVDRTTNTQPGPIADNIASFKARFVKVTLTGAATYTGTFISLNEVRLRGLDVLTPYQEWSAGIAWGGTTVDQRDADDDPDGDGRSNELERALGCSPVTPDATAGAETDVAVQPDGSLLFRIFYNKAADDLVYTLVHSDDLSAWSGDGASTEQFDELSGWYYQTWTAPADSPKAFVRLAITSLP